MKRVAQPSVGVTTALIYTRVSSDAQRDGASLDVQLRECRQYAASMGWAIGEEYTDIASGKRDDRPRYQEMLAAIRLMTTDGRRPTVIAWRLDRLGRRILERVQRREELKRLGCETHSATEGGMVSDITANVLAAVAEEETRVLSERVRGARRQLRKRGWHPVGGPAWGYRWRDATPDERARGAPVKVLEPDPATAPYVIEAFQRVASSETVRRVASWISGLPEVARGGRALAYPAVRKALRSPLYAGRFERPDSETGGGDGSDRARGQWSILVDECLWQRVQERMAGHARLPKQASGRYLLTGFLRCSGCGSRMAGGRRDGESDRYVCSGQQLGSSAPDLNCRMSAAVPPVDAVRSKSSGDCSGHRDHARS